MVASGATISNCNSCRPLPSTKSVSGPLSLCPSERPWPSSFALRRPTPPRSNGRAKQSVFQNVDAERADDFRPLPGEFRVIIGRDDQRFLRQHVRRAFSSPSSANRRILPAKAAPAWAAVRARRSRSPKGTKISRGARSAFGGSAAWSAGRRSRMKRRNCKLVIANCKLQIEQAAAAIAFSPTRPARGAA